MTSSGDCDVCPEGTFCPVGSAEATSCSAGTYNDQPSQEACSKCASGTFQDEEGQTACKACTDGYYCAEGGERARIETRAGRLTHLTPPALI